MSAVPPIKERIRLMSEPDSNGCWVWQRAIAGSGYGYMSVDGKQRRAQRVSYEAFREPIPKGLHTDHLCRNRLCVNPWHLEVVTRQENIRRGDGLQAINARKTHCDKGHEFTPENTLPNGRGGKGRKCRICRDAYMREYRRSR